MPRGKAAKAASCIHSCQAGFSGKNTVIERAFNNHGPFMQLLDATGLTCPLPVLRARKMLKTLAAGDVLEIHATDPASAKDFPAFCEATGHRLVDQQQKDGIYIFQIQKSG